MKHILRIIIALIFIASGFVKAVDVVGFSFKLEEYFSPTVFNIPFLEKLPEELRENYKADYKAELKKIFPGSPVFYPFKRTFIYAKF